MMGTGNFHLMAESEYLGTFETLREAQTAAREEDMNDMWIAEDVEWFADGELKRSITHKAV